MTVGIEYKHSLGTGMKESLYAHTRSRQNKKYQFTILEVFLLRMLTTQKIEIIFGQALKPF
jgi:hypothetical protein